MFGVNLLYQDLESIRINTSSDAAGNKGFPEVDGCAQGALRSGATIHVDVGVDVDR